MTEAQLDNELVARAQKGDQRAFELLVRQIYEPVQDRAAIAARLARMTKPARFGGLVPAIAS